MPLVLSGYSMPAAAELPPSVAQLLTEGALFPCHLLTCDFQLQAIRCPPRPSFPPPWHGC